MAEQHDTPFSLSALTRESSRVVGGRSRQSRRPSASRRAPRPASPPEPRRSSRLVSSLPRSDYSLSERWSYGADVAYETRCERPKRAPPASPASPAAHDPAARCVAHCTRSRTTHAAPAPHAHHAPHAAPAPHRPDADGLLPLDERDYAYSPYSSSTVTDLVDSDYSVYSPSAHRGKGKKRKRSSHRAFSHRRLDLDGYTKKPKIELPDEVTESAKGVSVDWKPSRQDREPAPDAALAAPLAPASCTYPLRSRHCRDLGPSTSTVTRDESATPPLSARAEPAAEHAGPAPPAPPAAPAAPPAPLDPLGLHDPHDPHEASSSKLLIVPRDLPYLRQTNARRSIAAATGATLGACLTRAASNSQRQRQEAATKRQPALSAAAAGEAGAAGRRARARDMPQPHPTSTRRDKRGKSSLGSCASTGSASRSQPQQPLTTGAVASTSATPPAQAAAAAAAMPDSAASDAKAKGKSSSSAEPCAAGGGAEAAAGASESSSEEGEVGRLQALLEARGLPPHLLGALGPRMQHLLHRTVAANSAASKAAQLLAGLQATGDEGQQLQAVIEMCQLLVMGNEDTLAGFPVRQVVPALVALLGAEHNFDMMNHACRALTYMLEALPRSSGAVALAVPAFLDKLQAITCMDVAEQSLTALDMLSRRHAKTILQARGVSACLTYLDFFSINAQRAALSITANCCQNLTPDEFHLVRDSLQLLANRLTQSDKKSVESVCLAFSRLVDSFQLEPARLQEIATPDLLANLQQLLVVQGAAPVISGATFITVLRLLWVMMAACPALAVAMQRRALADTLLCLLAGRAPHKDQLEQVELVARAPQELYEITCLMGELMPRLPADGIFAVDAHLERPWAPERAAHWQWRDDRGVWRSYSWAESRALEAGAGAGEEEVCLTTLGRSYTVDLTAMQQLNDHTGTARPVQRVAPHAPADQAQAAANTPDPRIAIVRENPHLIRALLAVLHEVYWSSAGPAVRSQALKAILRCVYYADAPLLRQVLKMQVISSHIAGMLGSSDVRIVVGSLQLAQVLMQRLPEDTAAQFRREGVLHQLAQLAAAAAAAAPLDAAAATAARSKSPSSSARSSGAAAAPASTSAAPEPSPPALADDPRALELPTSATESSAPDAAAATSALVHNTNLAHRSGSPLQLAEMLKRKRVVKRSGAAPPRHARRRDDAPAPLAPHASGASPAGRSGARAGASKATSFLSSLHPSRWGRAPLAAKDGPLLAAPHSATNLTVQNKQKVRAWISWTAARLAREWGALGGGGGALERLAALAALLPQRARQALHALKDTLQHDVSPFELNHSGVLGALLAYLTGDEACDVEQRLRLFLHVFADMPLAQDSDWQSCTASGGALPALVAAVNACVSHLEQFPVRVHDLPARPASSALKFFNTHQLMCDLKRHPNCTNLKQWKGGVVRIDPLALVQAIERYLAQRGYATVRARDGSAQSDDDAASDDDVDDARAAPAHAHSDAEHKLEFLIGDAVLPYNMTVYQAVRQFAEHSDTDTDTETPLANAGIWVQTHTIYYRAVEAREPPRAELRKGKGQPTKASCRRKPDLLWNEGVVPARASPLVEILRSPLLEADGGELRDAALPALSVLRALHALSRHWASLYRSAPDARPLVPAADFVNSKLAAKASRQLQDPLVIMTGNLPSWLKRIAYACPFVFPFECRHLLFYVVAMDRDRALQRLLEAGGAAGGAAAGGADERVAPRLDRRKRTVARAHVLRQAESVMHEAAASRALLEIQYENEVGTGLGPTLEFYALVSHELQRADLDLWHGSETFKQKPGSFPSEVVKSPPSAEQLASSVREALQLAEDGPAPAALVSWPCGLFPQAAGRAARPSHLSRVKAKFRFLGKFMAKAVMDSRMVDIPLSVAMYRWVVGEERWLSLGDVRHVAPELWRSLSRLQAVAERARALQADTRLSLEQRDQMVSALELDGCGIEDLGLDFILPGDGCTELRRGGRDLPVTAHNLDNYIALVTHWLVYEGVSKQMEAFREGFESVFPLANLKIFYPEELEQVFCGSPSGGREQRWDARMLSECIRPDHGFAADSRAIRMLVDILASYSRDEQRLFLQFVTGSPRLPTGGFKALNPPLTVVRKSLESSLDPDDYLPSVMTCVNYLKLPDYSTAEVMRGKLRLAASEGQHSFHLS